MGAWAIWKTEGDGNSTDLSCIVARVAIAGLGAAQQAAQGPEGTHTCALIATLDTTYKSSITSPPIHDILVHKNTVDYIRGAI